MSRSARNLKHGAGALLWTIVGVIGMSGNSAAAQSPAEDTPAIEARVDALLSKLTLEQKLAMLGGDTAMSTLAEPAIQMPKLKMSDGPMGVQSWGRATAFASGIGLAATWDRELAREVGSAMGEDARARGVHFLLGPGLNIYRSPLNGRNFEYFGEDPYLAGQIGLEYVRGVQSQGVVATVKHYLGNNSEYDRRHANAVIDERTLREIYLPAFETCVRQGQVGAVMAAFNPVNGQPMTQNSALDNGVLKGEWGFRGILMSDWDATQNGIAAANAGLDLEMPFAKWMNAAKLASAVRGGKISQSVIDNKIRRLLRISVQYGFLDREQTRFDIPLYNLHANAVALRNAEESIVLLKNDGRLLPLDEGKVHSIAVIGPDADPAHAGAGGSSDVVAFAPVSLLVGLGNEVSSSTKVYWNAGLKTATELFAATTWCADALCRKPGLERSEYIDATNVKVESGNDEHIDQWVGDEWAKPAEQPHRVEWNGYFAPGKPGQYRFVAAGIGEDRYQLEVNGQRVLEEPLNEGQPPLSTVVQLDDSRAATVKLIYWPMTDRITVGLGAVAEDEFINADAIRLAKTSDVVVLSVGFDEHSESEGYDRTYELPFGQPELIRAITAANHRTIVVLTAGGSVATRDWIERVPTLLQSWYPGQQGGSALAKILLGSVSPSGKLPISWEKRLADNPANYKEQSSTTDVPYQEGLFLGYRYYDTSETKPLYPFGFGLSYTSFVFSGLRVTTAPAPAEKRLSLSFEVRNNGNMEGAEVAQIYVGEVASKVKRPRKELKGYDRVSLKPGESRRIDVGLDARAFSYWDTQTHGWKLDPGRFVIYVGDSSANTPLQEEVTVQ
jgi:beta-glucosidase